MTRRRIQQARGHVSEITDDAAEHVTAIIESYDNIESWIFGLMEDTHIANVQAVRVSHTGSATSPSS